MNCTMLSWLVRDFRMSNLSRELERLPYYSRPIHRRAEPLEKDTDTTHAINASFPANQC